MVLQNTCTDNKELRNLCGIAAIVSSIALILASLQNLCYTDSRKRYPGNLVSYLGLSLLLFDLSFAVGWVVDFHQLNWDLNEDENDDRKWKTLCVVQGTFVQVAMSCMTFYSFWICYAFYNVIDLRHNFNLMIRSFRTDENIRRENGLHLFILMASSVIALVALLNHEMGWNSGIIACWIESRVKQMYYYYIFMIITLGTGIVFSVIATRRLNAVFHSIQADDRDNIWHHNHRPLRRVIYGNIAWTVSIIVIAVIPTMALLFGGADLCWMANIASTSVGLLFVLDFNVFPYFFERLAEVVIARHTLDSQSSLSSYAEAFIDEFDSDAQSISSSSIHLKTQTSEQRKSNKQKEKPKNKAKRVKTSRSKKSKFSVNIPGTEVDFCEYESSENEEEEGPLEDGTWEVEESGVVSHFKPSHELEQGITKV